MPASQRPLWRDLLVSCLGVILAIAFLAIAGWAGLDAFAALNHLAP